MCSATPGYRVGEVVEGGDDVEAFGDAFAVLGAEVEAQGVEAARREGDEHRFDDGVEPVAAPQRMRMADDDGAGRGAVRPRRDHRRGGGHRSS